MNPRPSTSSSEQEPWGSQSQMAAPNLMDPASYYYSSYRHQLEQQQSSSRLSAQELYISAVTELMKKQPIRAIASRPCGIANSNAYYNYFNVANPYGNLLHTEQPRLSYPNTLGQIVPAVTSESSNTAYSTGYSSGANSGLTVSPLFHVPTARPSQPTDLPPGPVPLACPEQREILVTPSRVAALNMTDPASYCYAPYGHHIEQQQSSSRLSVREQYMGADTGFIQPTGPISTIPCDTASSYSYYGNLAHTYGTLFHQQLPTLPNPSVQRQIVPTVTSESSNTAYNAGYSSGTNSELALSLDVYLPGAHPSQPSPLPPRPEPLARPEEQVIHVAPSWMDPALNPYTCKELGCWKSFKKPSELLAHKRWHDKEGDYLCEFPKCQMRFTDWDSLRKHGKTHAGDLPYECDVCKKRFSQLDRLKLHQRIHGPKKAEGSLRFKCEEPGCGKAFTFLRQLRAHTRWHRRSEGYVYSRRGCKLRFETKWKLQKHVRTHTRQKPYRCEICGKGFSTSRYLGIHMSLYGAQEILCIQPGCGKIFITEKHLKAHMRWHEGIQEYVCDWPDCEMAFETKHILERHMRTHTGEKPFKCDVCKKCFARLEILSRHKKNHIQNIVTKMVCNKPGCGKVLTNRKYLVSHMRWHEGVGKHICNVPNCWMAFLSKYALQRHMKSHTGEKPFECDICKKCFAQSGSLKRHMKIHTGESTSEWRGAQKQEATHPGTTDVPATQEGESNGNQERMEGAESKQTTQPM